MAEVLTIVFSSGWTFAGTIILLAVIGGCAVATAGEFNKGR